MAPSRPDPLSEGGSPALRAIAQLNRTVAGRARQGYTAQGLCAAIAAAALAASLAVLGGMELGRADLLVLAVTLGVLTLLMWRRANLRSDEAVARCVDEELGLRGAYLAAFEAGRGGAPSVMSELGAERLLGKVRRREVVEAATPHTVGLAALPFGAVALLVVCVGVRDSSGRRVQGDRARSFALSSDLSLLARDGAEQMDDAARQGLERAAAAAAGAAAGSGPEEMREVAEELEALALAAPPGSGSPRPSLVPRRPPSPCPSKRVRRTWSSILLDSLWKGPTRQSGELERRTGGARPVPEARGPPCDRSSRMPPAQTAPGSRAHPGPRRPPMGTPRVVSSTPGR